MYNWHVNAAIGRSRPLANDFVRVADGIAASLRHFSVSLSRTAEDGADGPRITRQPTGTRAQRSAVAAQEVSSLRSEAPKGIDARSLAAKPPQGFTIRRVDAEDQPRRTGFGDRGLGGYQGQGRGGFGTRGRGGTGIRGRGGARGAARGGRGRGTRGKRVRGGQKKKEDDEDEDMNDPYNEEELAYIANAEGGWPTPYVPTTSFESLMGIGPPVLSSSRGVVETAVYKMQVATGNIDGAHKHADEHIAKMAKGYGTLFESGEAKAVTQDYLDEKKKETAKRLGIKYTPAAIETLSEAEQEKLSKAWIAGHYIGPKPAEQGDILGQVEAYMRRNETYLPEDSRQLQAKLRQLLPASAQKSAASPGPARKPL